MGVGLSGLRQLAGGPLPARAARERLVPGNVHWRARVCPTHSMYAPHTLAVYAEALTHGAPPPTARHAGTPGCAQARGHLPPQQRRAAAGCGGRPRAFAGSPLPTPPRQSDADATRSVSAGRQAPPLREGLRVLHRCANYVVIDKEYDHRIYGNFADTVEKLLTAEQLPAARPCHRLDYATSGAGAPP